MRGCSLLLAEPSPISSSRRREATRRHGATCAVGQQRRTRLTPPRPLDLDPRGRKQTCAWAEATAADAARYRSATASSARLDLGLASADASELTGQLARSSGAFARSSLQALPDGNYATFLLHAATALEHLAKAVLAARHPSLIIAVDIEDW